MINLFQIIPEDKKDKEFVKAVATQIINESKAMSSSEKTKIKKLWDVYNNVFNNSEYDYLTKIGETDLTYPAKVRDIGSQLVRTRTNILESEQARRRFRFHSAVIDERSVKEKYQQRMKNVLDSIETMIDDNYATVTSTINSINEQISDLEKRLQVDPENEEAAVQLDKIRANMPIIKLEYDKMVRSLSRQQLDMDELKKRITNARRYNDVEMVEEISNAFIRSKLTGSLRENWDDAFRELIIHGQPCFLVDYNVKTGKVDFKDIGYKNVYHSKSSNNKWMEEGEWQAYFERLSATQIASMYDLTDDQLT